MPTRDDFVALNARELLQKGPVRRELLVIDDFDRAVDARHITRQPDLAVTSAADTAQHVVIGNHEARGG